MQQSAERGGEEGGSVLASIPEAEHTLATREQAASSSHPDEAGRSEHASIALPIALTKKLFP
jgi:hypothetical protein